MAILAEVGLERRRQDVKFPNQTLPDGTGKDGIEPLFFEGLQNDPPTLRMIADLARATTDAKAKDGILTWADVLREEYAEALAEDDIQKLRTELIQVAAVAVRWVEDIDRRTDNRLPHGSQQAAHWPAPLSETDWCQVCNNRQPVVGRHADAHNRATGYRMGCGHTVRLCSTCGGAGSIRCAAHQAGDGCEDMALPCPDCRR